MAIFCVSGWPYLMIRKEPVGRLVNEQLTTGLNLSLFLANKKIYPKVGLVRPEK